MTIYKRGELSKLTGCNIETIRFYENKALLPEPKRSEKGYRLYNGNDVKRLKFILRCRELGFTLLEIQELLGLVDGRNYSCADISAVTEVHIEGIQQKLKDLKNILKTLQNMAKKCNAGTSEDCPILDALFSEA